MGQEMQLTKAAILWDLAERMRQTHASRIGLAIMVVDSAVNLAVAENEWVELDSGAGRVGWAFLHGHLSAELD